MRGTSLLSDLQLPRHLTEGAGQTKGEGRPVFRDRALEGGRKRLAVLTCIPGGPSPALGSCGPGPGAYLDVVALAHAGAQGVQGSGQAGSAAALAEVVGDAAGEAQRDESAAQTCRGRGAIRAGPTGCHRPALPRGGARRGPRRAVEGPRGS